MFRFSAVLSAALLVGYCEDNGLKTACPDRAYPSIQRAVAKQLVSPATAVFGPLDRVQIAWDNENDCAFVATGQVDSQNSFGAMLRSTWVVSVYHPSVGSDAWVEVQSIR